MEEELREAKDDREGGGHKGRIKESGEGKEVVENRTNMQVREMEEEGTGQERGR